VTTAITPTREEFVALAKEHTVVPVWTQVLADLETPVAAFIKLVGDDDGFLLESVEHGERWSRYSFVGRRPRGTLTLRNGVLTTTGHIPSSVPLDKGMLAAMEELLRIYRAPIFPDLPPLQGGLMGHLGYDVVREIEFQMTIAGCPTRPSALSDLSLLSITGANVCTS
jgi:anthranilate synthase component 1